MFLVSSEPRTRIEGLKVLAFGFTEIGKINKTQMSFNFSMATILSSSPATLLQNKVNCVSSSSISIHFPRTKGCQTVVRNGTSHGYSLLTKAKMSVENNGIVKESVSADEESDYGIVSMHHIGILCENLERSLDFYQNLLGLKINEARPHDKLPYRGAWLWVGSEMIHLMVLPNPDPLTGRPEHGGRDRHACIAIRDVSKLKAILDKVGHPYTLSRSGRPAIFTRDPDANALEFTQVE